MTRVLEGALDAHGLHDLTAMSARRAAEAQYADESARYRSPREWWRVALLPTDLGALRWPGPPPGPGTWPSSGRSS